MTRINANLDPKLLLDQHLIAERRELPMVYAALRRSLRSKSVNEIKRKIPSNFTLNTGHVTFWYDKLQFLQKRYDSLTLECIDRGFQINLDRTYSIEEFPKELHGDYKMTDKDRNVIIERILTRFSIKPKWYKMKSKPINQDEYHKMIIT